MKQKRQGAIVEFIENNSISTQEEIVTHLMTLGYAVTQATISRDMKQLSVKKKIVNGKSIYSIHKDPNVSLEGTYAMSMREGIVRVAQAGNLLVVKTHPGMAMPVAATIDALDLKGIVGAIAGDDTVRVAIRTLDEVEDTLRYFESYAKID